MPATTRVVQIAPGPIPTLTRSAPSSQSSVVASAVATLPHTTSTSGASGPHPRQRPPSPAWSARGRCPARADRPPGAAAPAPAPPGRPRSPPPRPTRSRPWSSTQALGYWIFLRMSLTVMRPRSIPPASTTGSFSIRCSWRIRLASSSVVPTGTVTSRSLVITASIGTLRSEMKRRSRLVRIPTSFPSRVIGTPETWYRSMTLSASPTGRSGGSVTGSAIMPLSERFTLSTSSAWSAMERFLWMIPIPPARARAMARRASVTVSMAAERSGMLRRSRGVSCTPRSTSEGSTSERAGMSRTSSKVRAGPSTRSVIAPPPLPGAPSRRLCERPAGAGRRAIPFRRPGAAPQRPSFPDSRRIFFTFFPSQRIPSSGEKW